MATGTDIDIIALPHGAGFIRADHADVLKQDRLEYLERTKDARRRAAFDDAQMTADLKDNLRKYTRMDSTQTNMVARSLIYTLSQIQRIAHRESSDVLELAFPVNREGGAGIDTINYRELDLTGEFRLLADTATDLHEVGSSMAETPVTVHSLAAAMGWTQRDMERADLASRNGVPFNIDAQKRMAIMEAAIKSKNGIAWNGKTNTDLKGFFSYTLNPVSITGSWASATPEVVMSDFQAIANEPEKDTDDFAADTLGMDPISFMQGQRKLTQSDSSIFKWLMNNTGIRTIFKTSQLSSVTSVPNSLSNNRVVVAYQRSAKLVEFMLPRDVQFFPVQAKGFHYQVPVIYDTAGLLIYKSGTGGPFSFAVPS